MLCMMPRTAGQSATIGLKPRHGTVAADGPEVLRTEILGNWYEDRIQDMDFANRGKRHG